MASRLNKTKTNVKTKPPPSSSSTTPGPLRARHSIARPAQLDQAKAEEVTSLCRKLGIVVGRQPPDAKIVDALLTPSPHRFQLLCRTIQVYCPELEEELEELKPPPKMTLEEARFHHVMEFCHDAGLFDDGDEADLLKIKGELSDGDHLNFWLSMLRIARMMLEADGPSVNAEEVVSAAVKLTHVTQIFEELDLSPEVSSLLNGALSEKYEEGSSQSLSPTELRRMVAEFDSKLSQLRNQIAEDKEEDAEEYSTFAGQEDPPEALAHDTTVMKVKLLQSNLKDLVNTFLALYDASLKNAVASGGSLAVEPREEIEEMLRSTSDHQTCLLDFLADVRRILQRLATLRDACEDLRPVAKEMSSENTGCLALNLEWHPSETDGVTSVRTVYGDLFDNV